MNVDGSLAAQGTGRAKVLGALCCVSYTAIFATHYLVAKEVLKTVDPWALSWVRGWVGGLVLALLFWPKVKAQLSWSLLLKMLLLAMLGFGFNQMLFLKGLQLSTASHAALLSNTIPLVCMALSVMLGFEPARTSRIVGLLIAFAGVFVLFYQQQSLDLLEHLQGNLLILASVVCLSSFLVLAKRFLRTVPAEVMSPLLLILGGTLFAFLSGFDLSSVTRYVKQSWSGMGLMIFEVLISSSLAYYLNLLAMRYLSVSTVAAFAFLQLPMTAGFGFVALGTVPAPADFIVLFCVAVGALFLYRGEREGP